MGYSPESLLSDILNARVDEALISLNLQVNADGFESVIRTILEPCLEKTGAMWESGNISLAQSYVAGKITEEFLFAAMNEGAFPNEIKKNHSLVLGNIEDDFHVLGRRMVASFARLRGWDIVDLGTDVPARTFVDQAVEVGSPIIAVSAMMTSTALKIGGIREELEKRNLSGRIKLAVGGAIFRIRGELVDEVGGDGTAGSAMEAPMLFDRLLKSIKDGN